LAIIILFFNFTVVWAEVAGSPRVFQGGNSWIGLNKFDLTKQYLGTASGGEGSERYRKVTVAMARKSLADAANVGVSFVRVSATGFAPAAFNRAGDLDLWVSTPAAYWARIDQLMDDLEGNGLKAVFTFVWNSVQFPAMTGESVRDMLTNPQSKSYRLGARYVDEFVRRYRGRSAILFYELTNELNLGADLDVVGRCRKEQAAELCGPKGNYTTDEMIAFTGRLAAVIRNADAHVKISSGFSVPRKASQHLRSRPERVGGHADFTPDTPAQFDKYLEDIHASVDIISVHIYPNSDNARFGESDVRSTTTFEASLRAARKIGKPLFVGEFGDSERGDSDESSFTMRMLKRIAELKPDYSALWVWEFYQTAPYKTRDNRDTAYSMEPGVTDGQIARVRDTARRLGQTVRVSNAGKTRLPRVVLTWPLECAVLRPQQLVYAVASDDLGPVERVEFWIDDTLAAIDKLPPYQTQLSTNKLTAGVHRLAAKAFDSAGLSAQFETTVLVGDKSSYSACPRAYADAQ